MAKRVGANSRKQFAVKKANRQKNLKKSGMALGIGIIVTGVLCAVGYISYFSYTKMKQKFDSSSVMSVRAIQFDGASHVSEEKLLSLCGIKPGMKIYEVKESNVKNALSVNPWIKSVRVIKKLKGAVAIEIVERKPIALINKGTISQIDIHGYVLPFQPGNTSGLPLVSGLKDSVGANGRRIIKNASMSNLRLFLERVAAVDKDLLSRLSQIDLSDPERAQFTLQSSPTVVEIDLKRIDERLNDFLHMEDVLQGEEPPSRINLCYQNLAFVRQPVVIKNDVVQVVAD